MDWNNKEEVREYMREYKRTHNSNKKYYEAHKEEKLKSNKEYYEAHKEEIADAQKMYRLDRKSTRLNSSHRL